MFKFYFNVCPTNWCYEVSVIADDLNDAVTKVMEQENVDIEYIVYIKNEEA